MAELTTSTVPASPSSDAIAKKEFDVSARFKTIKSDTLFDLNMRTNGLPAKRGASGYQLVGYNTLEQFYRGDQWSTDPAPGAAQSTDNYCAVIVDNLSSLIFDDAPEINCPNDDPSDDVQEIKCELKEKMIWRVWKDNNFEIEFDEFAKQASLYGDGFIKGPYMEKVDKFGNIVADDEKGTWKIRFTHIENPASIRLIFSDSQGSKLRGFIHSNRLLLSDAVSMYGKIADKKGIKITAVLNPEISMGKIQDDSKVPMVNVDELWDSQTMSLFLNDKLLMHVEHNWGFVPLLYGKNNYIPNHKYGKSDIEDVLDPQTTHNRTNNDLANLLKWISNANFWGKNLEGMEALTAGISRIYSLPDDGEIHTFEKTGDPYIANTYTAQRRSAIIEISGVSESVLSSSQVSNASGRALALAFQGTIRKLNPRARRFKSLLQEMNSNILKLLEIYFPETKKIIEGDYRNEVYLPTTLLRNIVDTINKFQAGLISQDTAMREAGVAQPNLERRTMRKDLEDPVLGPQVARQPQLLPRLSEGNNQDGEQPLPAKGNPPGASQAGATAAINSHASGGAPTP